MHPSGTAERHDSLAVAGLNETWPLLWASGLRQHDEGGTVVLDDASMLKVERLDGGQVQISSSLTRWHPPPAVVYAWTLGDKAASTAAPTVTSDEVHPVPLAEAAGSERLAEWCVHEWHTIARRAVAKSLLAEVYGLYAWIGERDPEGRVTRLLAVRLNGHDPHR